MDKQDIYKYVEIDDSGCWNWTRAKDRKGYGVAHVPHRVYTHRLSYELSTGLSAGGKSVCHKCDNPSCINPDHLWLGSHAENMADMKAKGRDVPPPIHAGSTHWRYTQPEKVRRGSDSPTAKLTDAQVIEIRRAYIAGEHRDAIAERFGLSPLSIHDLVGGKGWKHLFNAPGAPSMAELKAAAKRNQKPGAKVTSEIVQEIRRRLEGGEMGKDLAVEYGLHKATISEIKLRKIWADVP